MIRILINLYIVLLIIDAILSYLPQFRHMTWRRVIKQACDFTLNPVRAMLKKFIPPDFPFDISPIIVILGLKLIEALW